MTDYWWWIHEKMDKLKRKKQKPSETPPTTEDTSETGKIHVKEEHATTQMLEKLFDKFKR